MHNASNSNMYTVSVKRLLVGMFFEPSLHSIYFIVLWPHASFEYHQSIQYDIKPLWIGSILTGTGICYRVNENRKVWTESVHKLLCHLQRWNYIYLANAMIKKYIAFHHNPDLQAESCEESRAHIWAFTIFANYSHGLGKPLQLQVYISDQIST